MEKLRIEHQVIETPSKKKIEVKTLASNYHIEVNPSDCGIYDRIVIQELIKQQANTGVLNLDCPVNLKVVVISEADKLSKDAQQALRRTMETNTRICRLILTAELSSRLIPAIKSRTLMIRVPAPTPDSLAKVLVDVAKKENELLDFDVAKRIAIEARRNTRRALMMAETMKVGKTNTIPLPRWQTYIKSLAQRILNKQTVSEVESIRNDFYTLQAHLMPTEVIFEHLVRELLLLIPPGKDLLRHALVTQAAFYEHRSRQSSKAIIHLEAFVLQFMSAIKSLS